MDDFWADAPTTRSETNHFEIIRTPPGGSIHAVIASEKFIGTNLHYYRGRSTPCRKNNCEACEAGHRPRWTGYVLIMSKKTRRLNIFEFTQRCYEPFHAMQVARDSLRGVVFTCRRTSSRPNGPLTIIFEEDRMDPDAVPPVPDLREILERIWEIKEVEVKIDFEPRAQRSSLNGDRPHSLHAEEQ